MEFGCGTGPPPAARLSCSVAMLGKSVQVSLLLMGSLHPKSNIKRVSLRRLSALRLTLYLDGVGKHLASRVSGIECSGRTVRLLSTARKALLLANFRSDSGGICRAEETIQANEK